MFIQWHFLNNYKEGLQRRNCGSLSPGKAVLLLMEVNRTTSDLVPKLEFQFFLRQKLHTVTRCEKDIAQNSTKKEL